MQRPSRLRALAELGANAESSAEALDRIGRVACRVLDVPVALVNLIGADRQRFVGCDGPEPWASMRELPLTSGFCPFALGADAAYTLEDARADPEAAANPAVRQLGVVAYAGVPLRAAGGEPIGTLCALDYEPRTWSEDDLALLSDLAAGVVAELQLLTATRLAARDQVRLRELAGLCSALAAAAGVDDVLDRVTRALDRWHARAVWLWRVDASGRVLRGAGAADVPRASAEPLSQVVETGKPAFLRTRAEVRERLATPLPDVGSVALLPLAAGEAPLGVLGVGFADERPLSLRDREYLAALGGISALAIARHPR